MKRLLLVLLLGAAWAAFFLLGGRRYLSLEALEANRDLLLAFTTRHYWLMFGAALLVYVAVVGLGIPGAAVMSLAIGFLFGRWVGTVMIVSSATVGATLAFLAARYLLAEAVRRRVGGRGERIVEGFQRNAFGYLLFLRLVPLFPFWLVNLVPALAAVSLRSYVGATALGIVPGSFAYANLGQALGRVGRASQLLSPETLFAFGLLGALALVPVVFRTFRARTERP